MATKSKVILFAIIIILILMGGCKIVEDKDLEENEIIKGEEKDVEVNDPNPKVGGRIADFKEDPNNWIGFNELLFHELINVRKEAKSQLTYEDFYQDIDYQLMMEEDKVLELFGSPNKRKEDPFAYKMYILEYDGLIVYINDYGHGCYATGYHIRSPEFFGPRGTKVGQSVGEVLFAYPLPDKEEYIAEQGKIVWGDETIYYGAYMAGIHHLENGEIKELRFAERTGYAGVVYEIFDGLVQSIYFFEMN